MEREEQPNNEDYIEDLEERAVERRSCPKFGDAVHEDVGSRVTMVSKEEILLERPPANEPSKISWPKMTRADIQEYAKVFMEVDTDRDGKITGDQARNLFLGWRLPREVFKQIWDLSDQANDSRLSLREFYIALYFKERYSEGEPLPSVIPNSVMLDETLITLAGPPTAYGGMTWNPASGIRPQQGLPGAQPVSHAGLRRRRPVVSQADGSRQFNQNAGGRTLGNSDGNQHSNRLVNSLDVGGQEATETTGKENVLLDSREKLEYYRTKVQDLVLYKSSCDNGLNEITERARADKGKAELLEKNYQEKYKQVAEIHSKLTIEEASFRDIQEQKMELQQAIPTMEQGGSADGILQVCADRIQSDLEELSKALAECCKKLSIDVNSVAIIELPHGTKADEAKSGGDPLAQMGEGGDVPYDPIGPLRPYFERAYQFKRAELPDAVAPVRKLSELVQSEDNCDLPTRLCIMHDLNVHITDLKQNIDTDDKLLESVRVVLKPRHQITVTTAKQQRFVDRHVVPFDGIIVEEQPKHNILKKK